MTPRILFVDHAGVLGGAELYLLDVARAYRSTSTVCLFEEGPFLEALRDENISAEVLPASDALLHVQKGSSAWRACSAVPEILSMAAQLARTARGYDLLFANSQKAPIVAGLASRWARTPLLWNLHDMLTADHLSAFNRWVAPRWANWCADRVIVNSEATREAFVESGGNRRTTGLVYNGIDAAPFETVSSDATQATRRELGLDSDVPLLGIFSRLARWKGQHVLLRALPEIPDAHLLLVGEALFAKDEAYRRELRAFCDDLDIEERVHFLGFRRDVPRLMTATDVLVHTSTAPEPFGRVLVEGMLARTPVVATRAGGPVEIIEDGTTGRLVPPGDPRALAQTLRALLDDPHAQADMVDEAYDRARTRFSVDAMLEAVDEQLRQVISS